MPPRILRTPAAQADLTNIAEYIGIENHDPIAARKFLDDFEQKTLSYAHQPEMGEPRPDLGEDLRSFAFKKNYVIIYSPLEDGIDILRVIHGARDYANLFGKT